MITDEQIVVAHPSDDIARAMGWAMGEIMVSHERDDSEYEKPVWLKNNEVVVGVWEFREWPRLHEELKRVLSDG